MTMRRDSIYEDILFGILGIWCAGFLVMVILLWLAIAVPIFVIERGAEFIRRLA